MGGGALGPRHRATGPEQEPLQLVGDDPDPRRARPEKFEVLRLQVARDSLAVAVSAEADLGDEVVVPDRTANREVREDGNLRARRGRPAGRRDRWRGGGRIRRLPWRRP